MSTVVSVPTAVIAPLEFVTSIAPVVSGTPAVGKKLKASVASWEPVATSSYEWYRDGAKIARATASTYVLVAKDKGALITVRVTGKRAGYASVTLESASVGPF